ncbi:lipase [Vairimorpha necatrix]|uniref:sn-1-specific diacylglycerol lipase n=1 Tax=Vairimorpha necatrix TaxID=6039 RepID=A0AAX4J8X9_9MICR
MEVSLRIRNIEIQESYDTIEFVYKNTCSFIKDVVTFTISTLQDYIFEKITIRLKSKGTFWDKYLGIVNIQISSFRDNFSKNNIKNILSSFYIFKTDFYDLNELKVVGTITYDYRISYKLENFTHDSNNDKFEQNMFNLFLDQEKSVLIKNFKSVIEECLVGSQKCKINFMIGVYLIEKYTSDLHFKFSKNLKFEDIKNIRKLHIKNEENFLKNSNFKIEKFLLGDKNFEYKNLSDFTNYVPSLDKINDSYYNNNMNHFEKQVKKENSKFNIFSAINNLIYKNKSIEEILDTLNLSMTNLLEDENIVLFGADKLNDDFKNVKLNFDRLFSAPINTYSINDVLKNDGYVIANKPLLSSLINYLYYAIGSYGDSWATMFCKKRLKINKLEKIDKNRKGILEFLNIENNKLLSVQLANEYVPEYIIFFDKENDKLVLSFKGTSTSEEALKDLNCHYTKFYEGYAHKGFKNMACAFVKHKTKEVLELLENYKTKNLLIVGHSLGGSLAVLVHLIYEKHDLSKIFNIFTIAFSPAPVVSHNLAKVKNDNIFIISYGNDFVIRTSYGGFNDMKYAACSIGNRLGFLSSTENIDTDLLRIRKYAKKYKKFPMLYCPGNNYHFKSINVIKSKKKISLIVYKEVELEFIEALVIIRHATIHHMLPHLLKVFERGISDWDEIDNEK